MGGGEVVGSSGTDARCQILESLSPNTILVYSTIIHIASPTTAVIPEGKLVLILEEC